MDSVTACPRYQLSLSWIWSCFYVAEAKEQVLANLANFAYDPKNYEYLRQLQVLDLFLDALTEDNETLVEFAIGKDYI